VLHPTLDTHMILFFLKMILSLYLLNNNLLLSWFSIKPKYKNITNVSFESFGIYNLLVEIHYLTLKTLHNLVNITHKTQ